MTCDDFQARFLAGEHSAAMDAHLGGCARCRAEQRGLDSLRGALADPAMWEAPGPELEHRVVEDVVRQKTPPPLRRPRRALLAVAAVTVAVVAVASAVVASVRRPDWSTDLIASDVAPSASAFVEGWRTEQGTFMRFEIAGLPPAGPDEYYEIWLTAPDGTHVSAGSFKTNGIVEASIGVARVDYPRVWITLEPTDDDLGPSGFTVLDDPEA